jgi:hypothetical protein
MRTPDYRAQVVRLLSIMLQRNMFFVRLGGVLSPIRRGICRRVVMSGPTVGLLNVGGLAGRSCNRLG